MESDRLEIERITNLIKNFGWEIVSEKTTKTDVTLEIRKAAEQAEFQTASDAA